MMAETGCDGVMIARGAMGNPWVFSEICAALDGRDFTLPSAAERFEVALAQVREMITEKGERVGVAEAKKHLSWYCHGMEGAAAARSRLMQAVSYDELVAILLNALKALGGLPHDLHLIAPTVIEPIQHLKTRILGNHNPRLHTDEILIALTICAATNPAAKIALNQLTKLRGTEAHSSVILSPVDSDVFRKLGINLTCEPNYQSKKLYHK